VQWFAQRYGIITGYQQMQKKQRMAKSKQDEVGEFVVEVEEQMGEWLDEHYPHGAKPGTNNRDVRFTEGTSQMPTTKQLSSRSRRLKNTKASNPELYERIKQEIRGNNSLPFLIKQLNFLIN
jgi:hypothetical protein